MFLGRRRISVPAHSGTPCVVPAASTSRLHVSAHLREQKWAMLYPAVEMFWMSVTPASYTRVAVFLTTARLATMAPGRPRIISTSEAGTAQRVVKGGLVETVSHVEKLYRDHMVM